MAQPRTMFEKIWDSHVIVDRDDGQTLVYVDRHLCHDGSFFAFDLLRDTGLPVRRPDQTFTVPDHYVPTRGHSLDDAADEERAEMIVKLDRNAKEFGVTIFGLSDRRQGIVHIVGPEQGISQPGMLIVCGDSHTSTHGALGAIAFGIGASEVSHVLATQSIWQRRPKTMRITVTGERPFGVLAKDVIMAIIARIGAGAALGHAVEYSGPIFAAMSAEERLTVCNMSIEAGARCGMIAPDETTFAYVKGRPYAPAGEAWQKAVAYWKTLPSDPGATFDKEVSVEADEIAPMVTWGTSPEDALPITGEVPDPAEQADGGRRAAMEKALDYMGLVPGMKLTDIQIDKAFIGSCTNSRIEDLRIAAAVVKGRRVAVPAMVVPGSGLVKRQAEKEGLDRVFTDAGFEWLESGCSMCVGMNGDTIDPGKRSASTSNRNFEGRQGPGARTHLMSPAMAAAAAVSGRLTDVRELSSTSSEED